MSRFVLSVIFACSLFAGVDVHSKEAQYDPVSMDPPSPDPAYEKNPDINQTAEVIPGDHSFSVSRIRLQRMVIDWMNHNCR